MKLFLMPTQCPNPRCHAENRDTAKFCSECGASLIGSAEPLRFAGLNKPAADEKTSAILPAKVPTKLPAHVQLGPPPKHPWIIAYLIALPLTAIVLGLIGQGRGVLLAPIAALIVSLPIRRWRSRRSLIGLVTHLREWKPKGQYNPKALKAALKGAPGDMNWTFDLQLTDKQWKPLQDRKGYLRPIVEVEFESSTLHGPPLIEGAPVVVLGRMIEQRFQGRQLWNCSPSAQPGGPGFEETFFGRAVGVQTRSAPDMRYPGQRSLEVWAFRLQKTDPQFAQTIRDTDGSPLPALPVEIRAQSISGPLQDGDKLEVRGQVVRGTLYAREILNHSARGAALIMKEWSGAA